MEIDIYLNTDFFLLGITYSDCIAENMKTGNQFETNTLSIGFLFFTIDLHFKPNEKAI